MHREIRPRNDSIIEEHVVAEVSGRVKWRCRLILVGSNLAGLLVHTVHGNVPLGVKNENGKLPIRVSV